MYNKISNILEGLSMIREGIIPKGFKEFSNRMGYTGWEDCKDTVEGTKPLFKYIVYKFPSGQSLDADVIICGADKGADTIYVFANVDNDWDFAYKYSFDYDLKSCVNIVKKMEAGIAKCGDGDEFTKLMKRMGFKEEY